MEPKKWNNDFKKMLFLALRDGKSLKFASDELKDNDQLVLEAVKQNAGAIKHASPRLQKDIKIVKAAVSSWGYALSFVDKEFRNNPEIVLAAIENNTLPYLTPFQYASDEVKSNPDVVMAAVKDSGIALMYAAKEFRNKKEYVLEALKTNPDALLTTASEEVRRDPEVIAFKNFYKERGLVNDLEVHNDKCFKKEMEAKQASVFGRYLKNLEPELKNNPEIIIAALQEDFRSIEDVDEKFRNIEPFAKYFQMKDSLEAFKNDEVKLKDIPSEYFASETFAAEIEDVISDRIYRKHLEEMQGDLSPEMVEKLEKTLQTKFDENEAKIYAKYVQASIKLKIKESLGVTDEAKVKKWMDSNPTVMQ